MAWRRMPRGVTDGNRDIGFALEDVVFKSVGDIERHYRASIEPQLACNTEYVCEIDILADEYRLGFDSVAGRLSIEVAARLACDGRACAGGSADLRRREGPARGAARADRRLPGQGAPGRVHEAELAVGGLYRGSGGQPGSAPGRSGRTTGGSSGTSERGIADQMRFADTPLESLVFVMEAFGTRWPRMADRPGSSRAGRGWNDPKDASAFIESTIHAIANRPEPGSGRCVEARCLHLRAYLCRNGYAGVGLPAQNPAGFRARGSNGPTTSSSSSRPVDASSKCARLCIRPPSHAESIATHVR